MSKSRKKRRTLSKNTISHKQTVLPQSQPIPEPLTDNEAQILVEGMAIALLIGIALHLAFKDEAVAS